LLRGLRILEVDDEADAREVVREALEQYGADVMTAATAAEAFAALTEFRPDVVVCDIGMPGEDGYSLMRRFRAVDEGRNIPAIALTGYARTDERLRALDVGYQGFVAKPVELDNLVSVIANLVGRA
jgi:CheY-like chemotaxis protein